MMDMLLDKTGMPWVVTNQGTSLTLEAKQESGACCNCENKLSKDFEPPNSWVGSNHLSILRGIWFTGINPPVRIDSKEIGWQIHKDVHHIFT